MSAGQSPESKCPHTPDLTISRDRRCQSLVDALRPKLNELLRAPHMKRADHADIPQKPGVYLFSKEARFLYVGQTRNIRGRLRCHTIPSSDRHTATFAFLIAKLCAAKAGVNTSVTAKDLESDDAFKPLFKVAKRRVSDMDVRFIEMCDPILRTVFEVYAAVALGTDLEYNNFETH